MSEGDYCPHCRAFTRDDDSNHGPNCPRYRGPPPGDHTDEIADLTARVEKLETIDRRRALVNAALASVGPQGGTTLPESLCREAGVDVQLFATDVFDIARHKIITAAKREGLL